MPSRFVVVANRLPVRRDESADRWVTSPGGLVSALTPILQERSGTWVGWTGIADDAPDPFEHEGIRLRTVPLAAREVENYYRGFCNGTIWPLYHNAIRSPEFHRHWWRPYEEVNRRFAEATAECLEPEGIAWVQDYQLQLVPTMLRELRPKATIGHFLHIPFPPVELFSYLPWREDVLEGLLGADVLQFQTRWSLQNFQETAARLTSAEPVLAGLRFRGREVRLQSVPIAVDTARFEELAATERVAELARRVREDVGPRRKLLLGVDRLDYTKGIGARLKAIATLLERFGEGRDDWAFLQLAVPSREEVSEYVHMRETVERLVGQINGNFGRPGYTPVTYMYRSVQPEELVALYRAADVMLVTPLADGMNLVAKEYVASRIDGDGVLVLSEFAGAAAELERAVLVNPQDVDGLAARLHQALTLSEDEIRARMRTLRAVVRSNDVFVWARRCIETLEA